MKSLKIAAVLASLFLVITLSSCADNKVIDGVTYRPYGLLNSDECKNDSIQYEVSGWACFSGIVFCEVIVPPIYTFGYNLFEPVGKKAKNSKLKGVVN